MLYVFVVIEHGMRRLAHLNVTIRPSANWTLQQLREVVGDTDNHKYLVHDRDAIFAKHLDSSIRALGLAVPRSPFASPKATGDGAIGLRTNNCIPRAACEGDYRARASQQVLTSEYLGRFE